MILLNPFVHAGRSNLPLPSGGVAWFRGENNAFDEGGNYDATAGSQSAYAAGYDGSGNAFSFNGNVNSKILVPSVNIGSAYSIEFWVYETTGGATYVVLGNDWTSATKFGALYGGDGNFRYYQNSVQRVSTGSAVTLSTSRWYKVRVTYDGSKTRIYVNDLLAATESGTHSETFNNQLGLGVAVTPDAGDTHLTGRLDEVILYNSAAAPATGLRAWYKGDSDAQDAAYTWHATAGAGTTYTAGNNGNCFVFNGNTNSAVQMPQKMPIGAAWTVQFDLYVSAGNTGYRDIVGNDYNASGPDFGAIYLNASKIEYWSGGVSRVVSASTIAGTTWTTVKITYDGSKTRIYINGSLDATESGTHTTESFATAPYLGASRTNNTAAFIGRLDDVKFYNAVV